MKKYVKQLLQDLEMTKGQKPPKPDIKALYPNHPAFKAGLDYIAEWEMMPEIPISELFKLKAEIFPPQEKLSAEEISTITSKILEIWLFYNIDTDFPEGIPPEMFYTELVKVWATETVEYTGEGITIVDFCDYNVSLCRWGEKYCPCEEVEEWEEGMESMQVFKNKPDDLPF